MPLIGEGGGGREGAWGWGRNQAAAPVPCSATIFWVLAVVLVSPVPRDGWQWQQSLQCKLRWSEVSSTGGALGTWGALCRGLSPLRAPKLCWEWGNCIHVHTSWAADACHPPAQVLVRVTVAVAHAQGLSWFWVQGWGWLSSAGVSPPSCRVGWLGGVYMGSTHLELCL